MTDLRKIAASLNSPTKTAAKAALKAAGMRQTLADSVLDVHAPINAARHSPYLRIERRLGHPVRYYPLDPIRRQPLVRLPAGKPTARLDALRKRSVQEHFRATYRVAAHGDQDVVLTTDPREVGVWQTERDDWNLYAKSYRHGPARVQDTRIVVPVDWRVRVLKRGLGDVDGMMTLDAAPLEGAPQGVELYAATWVVQRAGTRVESARGYIALSSGLSYHSDSIDAALRGLRRKVRGAEWAATLQTSDLSSLIGRFPDAVVRVSDAKAVGACEYGIRSWCAAVGIDYDAGKAPLELVYAGYCSQPRPEARGAILHALRNRRA